MLIYRRMMLETEKNNLNYNDSGEESSVDDSIADPDFTYESDEFDVETVQHVTGDLDGNAEVMIMNMDDENLPPDRSVDESGEELDENQEQNENLPQNAQESIR